jgi:hypothetical protein
LRLALARGSEAKSKKHCEQADKPNFRLEAGGAAGGVLLSVAVSHFAGSMAVLVCDDAAGWKSPRAGLPPSL